MKTIRIITPTGHLVRRLRPSGGLGESDLFGSQQYAPLFDVEIP